MNRKGIIGIVIGVVGVGILAAVVGFLGYAHELPGQSQPTRIPTVAPFSGISAPAPAATTASAASAPTGTPAYGATTAATSAPTARTTAAPPAGAVAAGGAAGRTIYAIAGDKSQAKVTVNEKLAALPAPSNAVLTTSAIQGQLFLGSDGMPVEGAKIQVDLRTLQSDKAQRDNYIRTNTLMSDQFPLAEYVITRVDGWAGPLTQGQQSTFTLLGTMTIHGVTKPVTFDMTAMMQGDAITGTAKTAFKFQDFGMSAPNIAIVKADDTINLEMTIVANKSA